eukprot:scaffold11327_cov23-Tisochrysis_lutea.AAC.1
MCRQANTMLAPCGHVSKHTAVQSVLKIMGSPEGMQLHAQAVLRPLVRASRNKCIFNLQNVFETPALPQAVERVECFRFLGSFKQRG